MFKTTTTLIRSLIFAAFPHGHVSDVTFQSDYCTIPISDYSQQVELAVPAVIYFNNLYSYRAAIKIMDYYLNIRAAWDEKTLGILVTQQLVDALKHPETFLLLQRMILITIKSDYQENSHPGFFNQRHNNTTRGTAPKRMISI